MWCTGGGYAAAKKTSATTTDRLPAAMLAYHGGKTKLAKHLVPILQALRKPGQVYLEPFSGMGSIGLNMAEPRHFNDYDRHVMALWRAAQADYAPPEAPPTREAWHAIRDADNPKPSAYEAFCMLACTFGGIKAISYQPKLYCSGRRRFVRMKEKAAGAVLTEGRYDTLKPKNCLIYCDPPYAGVITRYRQGTKTDKSIGLSHAFDHAKFWDTVRHWSQANTVVVSEQSYPDDFVPIWTGQVNRTVRPTKNKPYTPVREYLVMHRDLAKRLGVKSV